MITIFSLVRDLEELENCSSSPAILRLANRIFERLLAAREAATERNDRAILALLERLCLSHPHPRLVIREISHLLFDDNRGIQQDLERRVWYLVWGAELMDSGCTYMLARAYHLGHGVPVNVAEAIRYYRYLYSRYVNCSDAVQADAGMELAGLLISGTQSNQHQVEEAIRIYDDLRRFEVNGVQAALYLGALLRTGNNGVPADPQRAWNVYWDATRFRDAGQVLYEMGTMSQTGEGITAGNLHSALYFFELSVAHGYSQASFNVSVVRAVLEIQQDQQD